MSSFFVKNKLILSFITLNITNGTAGGLLQIIVPLYAMSLNATTVQIGMIRGVSGLGFLLLVIPAGFLVGHYGSKRLFVLGSLAVTFTTLAMVWARTPLFLTYLMGLQGFFRSLRITAMNSSFFRNLKTMGLEKAGWFKGSMSIGFTFIGPLMAGYLAKEASFPLMFQIVVMVTLLPTLLIFFFHKDGHRLDRSGGLREIISFQVDDFKLLLRRKNLYLPLLAESVGAAFNSAFSTFIIVIVVRTLNLKPMFASTLLIIEGAVYILTVFFAGTLIYRMKENNLYLLGFGVTSLGAIILALAENLPIIALATVIIGFGLGLLNMVTSSQMGAMEGDKGKIVGLFAASTGVGMSVGPFMGGFIGQYFGNRYIFAFFVPIFLLTGIMTKMHESRMMEVGADSNAA
ncbi:MAG: major facilitator superfamily [Geobacteraceae bacterium]|nr:MAG: major facilitator superfamily [Geobacteraceae bacterium]